MSDPATIRDSRTVRAFPAFSGAIVTVGHPLADHGIRCRFGWLGSDGWCHGELVSSGVRTRWLPRWVVESTGS